MFSCHLISVRPWPIVGASLSEPHTRGTVLQNGVRNVRVCLLVAMYCKFYYFTKIELEGEGLWPECSIGEVEACMGATYFWFERSATNYQWQVAHKQYKYGRSSRWLSGSLQVRAIHIKKALINVRHPTHDFSVNLSLSICSHSSCPGWRNVTARNLW